MDRVKFSHEIANEICRVISCTPKGLKKLCAENKNWPCAETIREWVVENASFAVQYARAKMIQVDFYVEDAIEHSKDASRDTYKDEKGKERCDHEWVNRSRLYIDTVKWYASKLAFKIYGDRVQVTTAVDDESLIKAKEKAKELLLL